MKLSNELLIAFLFLLFTFHSCFVAHGHGLHGLHKKSEIVSGSLQHTGDRGYVYKTVDGKCWRIYKDGDFQHSMIHIEETKCQSNE
jgi:hypothetical protein